MALLQEGERGEGRAVGLVDGGATRMLRLVGRLRSLVEGLGL